MKILNLLGKQPYAILLLLIALISIPSLKNSFLFIDDIDFIVNNPKLVFSFDEIVAIFSKPFGQIFDPSVYSGRFIYYRPALNILYMFNNTLWGINPVGFHITNLCLHLLTAILVYRSGLILFSPDRIFALLGAALFCVHPVHNELIGRVAMNENLLGFFIALSFLFYLQGKRCLSLSAFAVALLSKESAVMLPFILFLFEARKQNLRNAILSLKSYLFLLFCYLAVRTIVIGVPDGVGIRADFSEGLITAISALADYFRLLIMPYPLHIYYPVLENSSIFHPGFLLSLSICFLLVFVVWRIRSDKLLVPLLVGTMIMLAPVIFKANQIILSLERAYIAERQLYVPSIFFSLFMTGVLLKYTGPQSQKYVQTGLCAIILLFSITTAKASTVWEDDNIVYARLFQDFPESSLSSIVYRGKLLLKKGDLDKALALFKTALPAESLKKVSTPSDNPGASKYKELAGFYRDGNILAYQPRYAEVHYFMGEVFLAKGDLDRAIKKFKTALILEPRSLPVRTHLAEVYLKNGMFKEAQHEFRIVVNDIRYRSGNVAYDLW